MTSVADYPRRARLSHSPVIEAATLRDLELPVMPTEAHFRRDHFAAPELDHDAWQLAVVGPAGRELLAVSLADLEQLPQMSLAVVLECAGHRRAEFDPGVRGVQWQVGALSEAIWTGVRLADLLEFVNLGEATSVVLEGADRGIVDGRPEEISFARAIPLEKALDDTLLAWEMNGAPLPAAHGAPLRAIVPGWYATDSVKWLNAIRLLAGDFDGHFEASDYRFPSGTRSQSRRMTALSISSLLTSHADHSQVESGEVELRGIAWGSKASVADVEVSFDGLEWHHARLDEPASPYSRVFWQLTWAAEPGTHTIRVRATDWNGETQPETPIWNERGYANASIQRVHLHVHAR